MTSIIVAIGTFATTLLGGLFAYRYRTKLHYFISFSVGVLIAVAFLDIFPEMFEIAAANNIDVAKPLLAVVIGFLTIHVLEKVAAIHSANEDEYASHHHPLVGAVGVGSLVVHSFLDGVSIGLGFQAGAAVGVAVSIAILAHDFCDGLNNVTLSLVNKVNKKQLWTLLALDAVAPIFGVLLTMFFVVPASALVIFLGAFAGILLYIAASGLLPEAHSKHSSFSMVGLTVLGAVFVIVVGQFVA